jgi:Copper amine oxidase, enzyme domain
MKGMATRKYWNGQLLLFATRAMALIMLLTTGIASAQDRLIINSSSCQVIQEDYDLDFCTYCANCNNKTKPQSDDTGPCYYNKNLYLRVDFPDPDKTKPGTHWRFGLRDDGLKGLSIVDVTVQAAQLGTPVYAIKHAGLADIFVPYDDGSYHAYDMQGGYSNLDPIDADDLPPQLSSLVYLRRKASSGYSSDDSPKVAVECRDSGIAWLCKSKSDPSKSIRRRLHEVVVWAVFDGDNYDNIIEYRFREDGSIGFRYGATGYNSQGGNGYPGPTVPHVHNGLWRVSTQLFGQSDSEVQRFQHFDNGDGTFTDSDVSVPKETSVMWTPEQFTNLIVQSKSRMNKHQHQMGYEFSPWNRTGTARQSTDPWTLADFYVTNDHTGEDGFGALPPNDWRFLWHWPDDYLFAYLNHEVVGDPAPGVVVWYTSSAHHDPTDLDRQEDDQGNDYTGVTPAHWSGFDMDPHNLFDYNPVGDPKKCEP